ncbi:MAG: response regulator [Chloroflexi bacterium]|nr:response regulator [Chloroflexota bacterium]
MNGTRRPKVMLVDDDPATGAMLQTLLQLEGFDTITCQDFNDEDVIRTLKHHQPDVLLMDVNLRNGNGLEILRKVRADAQLERLQILMVSGMELSRECERLGANGFLLKPYPPGQLLSWLHHASGS